MRAAFDRVYLVELDVDEWGGRIPEDVFDFDYIPIFYRLDSEGSPTGDWIDGGAWGPDTYANIARTLGPWFAAP